MTDRIVGIHAVEAALRAGAGERLLVSRDSLNKRQQSVVDIAGQLGITVVRQQIDSGAAHQGVVLEVRDVRMRSEKELASFLEVQESDAIYLALDGVTDPRNFGACLRNAASFGVRAVLVPKDKSAPLSEAALKAASGGASIVPIFQVTNLARALKKLKAAGSWIIGTILGDDTKPLPELDLAGPVTLVMGAENRGLRQKTRDHCDFLAEIPAPLPDLSLNVSVATGICLYEIHRQRSS